MDKDDVEYSIAEESFNTFEFCGIKGVSVRAADTFSG